MAWLALEHVVTIVVSVAVSLGLIQLYADPVSLVLSFDFSNELDLTLFSLVFKRDQRYSFSES